MLSRDRGGGFSGRVTCAAAASAAPRLATHCAARVAVMEAKLEAAADHMCAAPPDHWPHTPAQRVTRERGVNRAWAQVCGRAG